MQYRYKARNARGEALSGVVEAAAPEAVARELISAGVTPITIEADAPNPLAALRAHLPVARPTLVDLVLFCRQMYTLLHAGVPIIRAMNGLQASTRSPALAAALKDVAEQLEGGRELAGSLARHPTIFTTIIISLVQVGEQTGNLDQAFLQLAQYLELEKATRARVASALRYPALVFGAIAIAIAIINLKVIPVFAKVYAGFKAELPMATKILIATSNFTVAWWPYLLAVLVLAVVGTRLWLQSGHGRYRWGRWKLRLPIAGSIILRATLARFARAFAMSARAGVPLIPALTVVARAVDNDYVAERVLMMRNSVERGEALSRGAAATGLFTPLVLQMLAVGEETGQVDDLLAQVADFYEREVDYDLKRMSDLIEPIVIGAVGVLVLILALGVFLPMWNLAAVAKGGG